MYRACSERASSSGPFGESVVMVRLSGWLPMAHDANALWRLLRSGTSAITKVRGDRPAESHLDDLRVRAAVRRGGFLDQVGDCDPASFENFPRDAADMDGAQA